MRKIIKSDSANSNSTIPTSNNITKRRLKNTSIYMALLPLAACGGGGGGGGQAAAPTNNTPAPNPPVVPDPDFTENPANVFIAVDNSNSTLSEGGNTANLTVTGKAGSDSITTGSGNDSIDGAGGNDTIISSGGADIINGGSGNDTIQAGIGNDFIRGGEGRDNINAGGGNDAIVVVGTTTAGQYSNSDITNPAGSGTNLSGLISLADLNGRTVSEIVAGEVINGGTGTNTLFIYGTVDLTGVTLSNVTVLVVNSDVTLTAAQMAAFTTVDGDGTSTINIEVPPGNTYIIDLSSLNFTDIGNLNIEGNVTFIIDDASDLNEIGAITTETSSTVKVEVNGNGGNTTFNLGDIAAKINSVDNVSVAANVTLEINDAGDITNLGLSEISGDGKIDTGGNSDIQDTLDSNVDINIIRAGTDTYSTNEDTPAIISIADILSNDSSETPGNLSANNFTLVNGSENNAELFINSGLGYISVTPNQDFTGTLTLQYTVFDSDNNRTTGTISVNVSSANDLPTGYGSSAEADQGMTHDGAVHVGGFLISYDGERLNIEDPDNNNNSIYIRVEEISGGYISNSGTPVTEFTYNDVNSGEVVFVSTGGTPSLVLSFSNDGFIYGNPTPVEITDTDPNSIYVITQGGTFGNSETLALTEKYLLDGEDKLFFADDNTATFTNHGVIESYGIGYLTPLYMIKIDQVANTGLIDVDAGADKAAAIYISETGNVDNSGLIRVSNSHAGLNQATGVYAPNFVNSGTVHVSGGRASGVAHSTGVNLDNSGIIYVYGAGEARGVDALFGTSTITNSGSIIVEDGNNDFRSIGMSFNLSIADVTNTGIIQADVAFDANYSLTLLNTGYIEGDFNLSIYSDQIDNFGQIFGNISFGDAADWFSNVLGQTVGIVSGGAGDDFLLGGAFDDYFAGDAGNDYLSTGSGGADVLSGGTSHDKIDLQHYGFERVDGGSGLDTLGIVIDNTTVDFADFEPGQITKFEIIELSGEAVTVTLSAENIVNISEFDNTIRINGQANDTIVSSDTWSRGADQIIDTITYRTYTSGDATLLLDENVAFTATTIEPVPDISINDVAVNESDETATFTVTLSQTSNETITVDYNAPDGSSGTLTFNPGETEKTFTTAWIDDALDEADENVNANLSNPVNASIIDDTGTLTIINDDAAVNITIDDVVANENDETATFTVTLSAESGKTVSVDYAAPDGTSGTLTFNPGETEKTFNTVWTDDILVNADVIANATLSNPANAAISDNTGQLTIVDDDDDSLPTISINDISVNEAVEIATFIVTLSKASSQTVHVNYLAPDGSSGILTFAAGETVKTFNTTWEDDNVVESDEDQYATLSNASNATISDDTGQLTIIDAESVGPTISISGATEYEGKETGAFWVSLSAPSTETITVDYDHPNGSSTVTFNPGETSKGYAVTWDDDATIEADEVFIITLSNANNATILDDTAQIIILDDDGSLPVITMGNDTRAESLEFYPMAIWISEVSAEDITVDYTSAYGSGTATIEAGELFTHIALNWSNDVIDEMDEVVTITLSNPTNAVIGTETGSLTLVDDDNPPTITISDVAVIEANETATFTVTLSQASGRVVSVEYNAPDGSSGTLIFTPGETELTFDTVWTDDATEEANEIVNATLSNPSNATIADASGQLTIIDDDGSSGNTSPLAVDDQAYSTENQTLNIDVLENDFDLENDTLSISAVSVGANQGTVSIVNDEIQFDPGTDFDYLATGQTTDVTIDYSVYDGNSSDDGVLTLTITGENDTPVAVADNYAVDANDIIYFDPFVNDYDPDGDSFSLQYYGGYSSVGEGDVDTVSYNFIYDPETDFDHLTSGQSAAVDISYRLQDSVSGDSANVSTITITIDGTDEGEDDDTFIFVSSDMVVDLVNINPQIETEMENIDLTGLGDNSINLTINDLIEFTDDDNILKILGNTGDTVTSAGEGWVQGTDQDIDGEIYHTYTASGTTLLIDEDISQTIS